MYANNLSMDRCLKKLKAGSKIGNTLKINHCHSNLLGEKHYVCWYNVNYVEKLRLWIRQSTRSCQNNRAAKLAWAESRAEAVDLKRAFVNNEWPMTQPLKIPTSRPSLTVELSVAIVILFFSQEWKNPNPMWLATQRWPNYRRLSYNTSEVLTQFQVCDH